MQAVGVKQKILRPMIAAVGLFCASDARNQPVEVIAQDLPNPEPVAGREIALVFEDGPLASITPQLLDLLKKFGMHATFSVVGKNVEAFPDIAKRIAAEGHEMVNQTYSHPDVELVGEDDFLAELDHAQKVIREITGVEPRFFCPPEGTLRDDLRALVRAKGYQVLEPTLDSGDWRSPPTGEVSRVVLTGVTPGAVILFHESFPKSIAEMPEIFTDLSRRGFSSLTISELRAETSERR